MARLFKTFILGLSLLLCAYISSAQIVDPIKWKFRMEQKSPDEATLYFTATMDEHWHVFSQYHVGDFGLPTIFTIPENKKYYALIDKVTEPTPLDEFEPITKTNLKYFEKTATFSQKIKVICKASFKIKGSLNYQACNEESCLAPTDVDFSFVINKDSKEETCDASLKVKGDTSHTGAIVPAPDTTQQTAVAPPAKLPPSSDPSILEKECSENVDENYSSSSFLGTFILSFLGGLLALITPCVFPMIPMTVSFFTKRSQTRAMGIRNAIIYALSIIAIYVSLGLLVTIFAGPSALNELASNSFFNLLFFVIFVIFALSFFGAFEIVLPSSWINKADSQSDKGGVIGIFFMAFTLSLVSFSCTGPIIGTLLVEAAHSGSVIGPAVGMFGFSLALALPFALFAMFPSWLSSLPKSGGWLNSVKVCLGFIELALALKFLSNVDLAYHWGILQRELFLALWIIIFGLMGLYLIGKIKFSHDSEMTHLSTPRLIFAILTFTFTLYLIPGLWGAPLKIISGFPPPDFYKEWITQAHECPHNLHCFHDYDEGMAFAKANNKPVIVDFTGWACVNCRKMEDNVWSSPKVLKRLSENYVLVSLYVDDKKNLTGGEQQSPYSSKRVKTTGQKWSDLQTVRYLSNTQPYYVLIDHNERILAKPRGYTPDVDTYVKYLDEGLCRFERRKNK